MCAFVKLLLVVIATIWIRINAANGQENVALGRPTSQTSDLFWADFLWRADLAVDDCLLRDFPETSRCCSSSQEQGGDNYWRVDLAELSTIQTITIYGRSDTSSQLESFQVFTQSFVSGPELLVYDNMGVPYDTGVFTITLDPPVSVLSVIVRRPGIVTLCEVQVFTVPLAQTTTTDAATTTQAATTTVASCPDGFYGPQCTTPCGNCKNGDTCEITIGVCPIGCAPGWQIPFCNMPCADYTYGEDCLLSCGNCLNGESCDKVTGACTSGCTAGWTGINCDSRCPGGLYGPGCSQTCGNCANGDPCDHVVGTCVSCAAGWQGLLCDTPIPTVPTDTPESSTSPTLENVALGRPASQTSDLFYAGFLWSADLAVDGCLLRDSAETQQCCSSSQEQGGDNYWRVDLTELSTIQTITVYGRSDNTNQLEGFQVFIQNQISAPELLVYDNTGVPYDTGVFTFTLDPPVAAISVIVRRPGIVTICEVQVFPAPLAQTTTTEAATTTVASCPDGFYGPQCTTPCGNCKNGDTCEITIGVCPIGCAPGWQIPFCNLPCADYTYGEDCLLSCGNCLNGESCDKVTGACTSGCTAGWTGINCDSRCPGGLYGPGCTQTCGNCANGDPCDHVVGTCVSCAAGWQGVFCDTPIPTVPTDTPESSTSPTLENVALGRPASQTSDLFYAGFLWSADLAVDGCLLRDSAETQQCCSSSQEVGGDNYWRVDLTELSTIQTITVYGRSDNTNQLEDFQVFIQNQISAPELLVYDNTGVPYDTGVFTFTLDPPVAAISVIVRRPGIVTICEVQVFLAPLAQTTTTQAATTTVASCPDGFYGPQCTTPCGNCKNGDTCEITIGVCPIGCAPGWQIPFCNMPCADYTYGEDCLLSCGYCFNGESCDKVTGACTSGCTAGWTGINCDSPITQTTTVEPEEPTQSGTTTTIEATTSAAATTAAAFTNVAQGKPASQLSDVDYIYLWTADLAVDGCYLRDDPDTQGCCSSSIGTTDNFWRVDLQQQYIVNRIVVYGRDIDNDQLADFLVFVQSDGAWPELQVYNNADVTYGGGIFTIELDPAETVRFVKLTRPSSNILTICEVEIYGVPLSQPTPDAGTTTTMAADTTTTQAATTTVASCPDGFYGPQCTTPCGNCKNGDTCEITIGVCPIGCAPGWQIPFCNMPCADYTYGEDCLLSCGNCFNGESCDKVTGACTSGCTAGWTGINCDSPCPGGLYGFGCTQTCGNCANGDPCDHVTGACISCAAGWQGVLCDTSIPTVPTETTELSTTVAIDNVALNKPTSQLSDLDYVYLWTADKAVDGCTLRDDPDVQMCCSSTQGTTDNFWRVDLEQEYLVNRIIVYGRIPDGNQMEGFLIFVQPDVGIQENVYDNTGIVYGDGIFIVDLVPVRAARHVILTRPSSNILTICEVEVYGVPAVTTTTADPTTTRAPCEDGFYGLECVPCGSCENGAPCDKNTGICPAGCTAGWQFNPLCDTPCTDGTHGANCALFCGNCLNGDPCDKVTGVCFLGCAAGWQTGLCATPCTDGTHGPNCALFCGSCLNGDPCNKETGLCPAGCAAGWQTPLCDTSCTDGTHGPNCGMFCGSCLNGDPCNKQTGLCPAGCAAGWQTPLCDVSCADGTYGLNCGFPCGSCLNGDPCDKVSGQCTFGCASGWLGTNCDTACADGTYGLNCGFPCGSCLNGDPCDKVSGQCTFGCASGWLGINCDTACPSGLYGPGCTQTCGNCANGDTCNHVTGVCISCAPGWQGLLCDTTIPTASDPTETTAAQGTTVNVALNKPATQLSDLDYVYLWTADKAVDGCTLRDDPDVQMCCSSTQGTTDNFWRVDLLQPYTVSRIVVYGRIPDAAQLEGFLVSVQREDGWPEIQVYSNVGQEYGNGIITIDISPPEFARFVKLTRPTGIILTLCEVEVYAVVIDPATSPAATSTTPAVTTSTAPACSDGYFGADCANTCGSCFLDQPCDKVTGECPFGCAPGWISNTCDSACPAGFYGDGCMSSCGNCNNGDACNHVTGVCVSCAPGWEGILCDNEITTVPTSPPAAVGQNVALYKPATQLSALDYIYLWTADKGVDGCTLQDDPDTQMCCSATQGTTTNFWRVDLLQQYMVDRIVVYGRDPGSVQLENFIVYIEEDVGSPDIPVYDNTGVDYGNGIFTIPLNPPRLIRAVKVMRPTGDIIVICEVQVYEAVLASTSTALPSSTATTAATPSSAPTTPSSTAATPTSTVTSPSPTPASTVPSSTPTPPTEEENVALNKPASQLSDLNYLYLWTADKAVDGCTLNDNPDAQMCCSSTEGTFDNFWRVDLLQQYTVSRIVVYGRGDDDGGQLTDFLVYTQEDEFSAEELAYSNNGVPYGDGTFFIDLALPKTVRIVKLMRPTENIMTICEVEVYGVPLAVSSTMPTPTSTAATPTPSTSSVTSPPTSPPSSPTASTSTASPTPGGCPEGFYGNPCQPCGNCRDGVSCDQVTGACPISGCDAGWQGVLCDTECSAGFYGEDCLQACGNCLGGVACNSMAGTCLVGCAAGWQGSQCLTPCPDGSYGSDCLSMCGNCLNGEACNKPTGVCTSGCAPGWLGQYCIDEEATPGSTPGSTQASTPGSTDVSTQSSTPGSTQGSTQGTTPIPPTPGPTQGSTQGSTVGSSTVNVTPTPVSTASVSPGPTLPTTTDNFVPGGRAGRTVSGALQVILGVLVVLAIVL